MTLGGRDVGVVLGVGDVGCWERSPIKYIFCDKNYFCLFHGILPSYWNC